MVFRDRREAGRLLAGALADLEPLSPVVIALPRGGVPVGYEVALALGAPFDVGLVRKIGAPGRPELGIGAIGEDGTTVMDREAVASVGARESEVEEIVARERAELDRRRSLYRADRGPIEVAGRTVILVDDGIATGVTAVAAARVLRARGARQVVVAVPVCPRGTDERLAREFDRLVCLDQPARFPGVGAFYKNFEQTTDAEVLDLLSRITPPDTP